MLSDLNRLFLNEIQQKMEKDPKDTDALIKFGVFLWEPFHESDGAVSILQRVIEQDPTNTDALFWLSKVYYHDFCNYKGAWDCLKKALGLSPDRADCLSLISSVANDLGAPLQESTEFIQWSIDSEPNWPIPREILIDNLVQQKLFKILHSTPPSVITVYQNIFSTQMRTH